LRAPHNEIPASPSQSTAASGERPEL
jgi:hypothetical protein